jgi:hypothetical protein
LIRNEKSIVLFERHCHATEKSETIACARRCRYSRSTRWWTKKNNWKKWRAEEEERHKGSLTPISANIKYNAHKKLRLLEAKTQSYDFGICNYNARVVVG